MRVALYYPWIYLTSGAERVLLQLTRWSRHEWTLFTNRYQPESTFPEFGSRKIRELERVPVDRRLFPTAKAAWTIWRQRLPLENYDALVVVCEGLGDLIVLRNHSLPALNICLTPLRIAFDEVYQRHSLAGRGWLYRAVIAAGSMLFKAIDRRAWRRYSQVFCISQESLQRVRAGRLGEPSSQEVLHVGIGFEPKALSTRFEPFFLLPGRIMWTKNLELGIQAFKLFHAQFPEYGHYRLVVAGIVDEKSRGYFSQLRALGGDGCPVEFRVFPSDEELASLYAECQAVLFTAFNEDWGMVPIEAMAFGKPVIAVNRGGPRESVVHGKTGFLEEADPAAFASRMAELAGNPALVLELGRAGHQRAKAFSWQAFAEKIDSSLDRIVGTTACRPALDHVAVSEGQTR